MSTPLSPVQQQIAAILGPFDFAEIPGGCDRYDAYRTVEPVSAGVWLTTVHHDDWCPVRAAHRKAT